MNNQKNIERELLEWAFDELRRQFKHEASKFEDSIQAARECEDTIGMQQFNAAATAWKQAYSRLVEVDIRVMLKRYDMERKEESEL